MDVQDALKQGLAYAAIAASTNDSAQKTAAMAQAIACLKPISSPEHRVPRAAFGLGILAYHMAIYVGHSSTMEQERRLETASLFLHQAAKYFETAASMPDYEKDLTPARAKDSLALLYENGVLEDGKKDLEKALILRWEAAEAGFAEAQVNLAIMFYRGEGTPRSLPDAHEWIGKAWSNKDQLPERFQSEVEDIFRTIKTEMASAWPSHPFPRYAQ
jgi:TPR repeat protein